MSQDQLTGRLPASAQQHAAPLYSGCLVVNADDWGFDAFTTDKILQVCLLGAVTSVSAMVFMEDSQRAAELARTSGIEAGLHLNCTSQFSGPNVPRTLAEHQQRLAAFLLKGRYAQVLFNPALAASFGYVVNAQLEEYERLYGEMATRIDGHHHMHLCANVLLQRLMPKGTMARRSFSFFSGQKSRLNRCYRGVIDRYLRSRHPVTDYFFSLPPLQSERLRFIFGLARNAVVELETHPAWPEEHRYLSEGRIFAEAGNIRIAAPSKAEYRSQI